MDIEDVISVLSEAYDREDNLYYSNRIGDVLSFLESQQVIIDKLQKGIQSNIDRAKRYKDHKKKPNQCVDLIHYELTKLATMRGLNR